MLMLLYAMLWRAAATFDSAMLRCLLMLPPAVILQLCCRACCATRIIFRC